MKNKSFIRPVFLVGFFILSCGILRAENIDPYENGSQYAYGANVGWVNFEPNVADANAGAMVSSEGLTGYIWIPNIGWVSLSCSNTKSCRRVSYGVVNDGAGNLSGYAWSANAGWISFSCENTESCKNVDYGVTIDSDGVFHGWAYGQNVGWIHLQSSKPVKYEVQACVASLDDLANFADDWLLIGFNLVGDLDGDFNVKFDDYSIFAGYWQDYCPQGWLLK
jgi:hypothetical protein